MRCAQQPRGLPPWARAGLVSLSSGWSAHLSPKPGRHTPLQKCEFEKRGHAGTADHHMRAGGIQERKDLLYAACHAVSSRFLKSLRSCGITAHCAHARRPPSRPREDGLQQTADCCSCGALPRHASPGIGTTAHPRRLRTSPSSGRRGSGSCPPTLVAALRRRIVMTREAGSDPRHSTSSDWSSPEKWQAERG